MWHPTRRTQVFLRIQLHSWDILTCICCRWLWELKFSVEEGSATPADTAVACVRTPVPSMVAGSWEALEEEEEVVGT